MTIVITILIILHMPGYGLFITQPLLLSVSGPRDNSLINTYRHQQLSLHPDSTSAIAATASCNECPNQAHVVTMEAKEKQRRVYLNCRQFRHKVNQSCRKRPSTARLQRQIRHHH